VMTAPAFHDAHLVASMVAAGIMVKGCYLIVLPGISFAEKLHKQSAVEWIAAAVNVLLNLWLIPRFGIVGASVATFVTYLSLLIFAWLVARHYLAVDYEWKRLGKITMVVLLACSSIYYMSARFDAGLVSTVFVNSTILFLFVSSVYLLLMTTNEREQLWSKLWP
jgi:O-antigen/teichoic acid export membrane protein